METLKEALRARNLRFTSSREEILAIFGDGGTAISHGDIENLLGDRFDRVTIYRTLRTFVDKGILHKVLGEDGQRYALCSGACSGKSHHHNHVHFKCSVCGLTSCLDRTYIPSIHLPKGYQVEEMNLLLSGVCSNCSASEAKASLHNQN